MANVIDYLKWRGDLSFRQSGFNEVDNILMVFFTFPDYGFIIPKNPCDEKVTLKDAVDRCFEQNEEKSGYYGAWIPNEDITRMARMMAKSRRFRDIKLTGYVNDINLETEEQFSAYTAFINDKNVFISFKGTDDTLVGWKENLNMSFNTETSGQKSAAEYVNKIGTVFPDVNIIIGGHSKGGNFAVYSAACCREDIQRRIIKVYNNDGPGFNNAFLTTDGYLKIKDKVLKLVPQESVVGMLLGNDDNYTVINSTGVGVLQHNSYLWEVMGTRFIRRPELTQKSVELSHVLNGWIEEKDIETRRELSNAIYEILTAADAKTLTDFNKDRLLFLKSFMKIEPKKRDMVVAAMMQLFGEFIKTKVALPKNKENKESVKK